ncbi:MAG: hypothetical protein QOI66_2991, partial [Myxococcales bacterium]|nr:hypothetical protein [Myxococcales bacterium]
MSAAMIIKSRLPGRRAVLVI